MMITENKTIKNIIFDFGGVLLDIDISLTVDAFRRLGIDAFSEADIHPNTKGYFLELEEGKLSTRGFFDRLRRDYPVVASVSDKELFEAWCALLLDFNPERFELVKSLGSRYKLFLLSNTNYPHRVRFLNTFCRQMGYDMESLFDKCYYSDELGMRKPDRRIYETVLQDAGLDPRETVFIDDNYINIPPAEACGIMGYHLKAKEGECILDILR